MKSMCSNLLKYKAILIDEESGVVSAVNQSPTPPFGDVAKQKLEVLDNGDIHIKRDKSTIVSSVQAAVKRPTPGSSNV